MLRLSGAKQEMRRSKCPEIYQQQQLQCHDWIRSSNWGAEVASGNDLSMQLMNGGVPSFFTAAAIFSAASLVPLLKGVTVQSKSGGLMNANAEMWNGRFAMLGLVALAFTEYVKGGPLV